VSGTHVIPSHPIDGTASAEIVTDADFLHTNAAADQVLLDHTDARQASGSGDSVAGDRLDVQGEAEGRSGVDESHSGLPGASDYQLKEFIPEARRSIEPDQGGVTIPNQGSSPAVPNLSMDRPILVKVRHKELQTREYMPSHT
jgi:hypothetical protein